MASDYMDFVGTIQFDPETKDANGKKLRNVTIKSPSTQAMVRLTIWENFGHVKLSVGDFVAGTGKYSKNEATKQDGTPVTYHNISVSRLCVLACEMPTRDEQVVNSGGAAKSVDEDCPF